MVISKGCKEILKIDYPEICMNKKRLKEFYKILYNTMKKFPEYKLVVKGRKGDYMNNLPKMIAKQEKYKIDFVSDINPIELLSDAEIVIVHITTMFLDGLALDKPVISFWDKSLERFADFSKIKVVKSVYNQKQLEQAIKECQTQTKKDSLERKKFLEEELFKFDGKASKRIANFLNKLIIERKQK